MKRELFFVRVSLIWLLLDLISTCCVFFKEGRGWDLSRGNVGSYLVMKSDNCENMGLLDFFGKGKENNAQKVKKGKKYNVHIPEEKWMEATLDMEGKTYVCIMNVGLLDLEPKAAFNWYLSLILDYELPEGMDMPSREDTVKKQDFIDELSEKLAENKDHPNAIILGRVTGDGMTHAMWYVNNPEKANAYLQSVIASEEYPFHFEFVMEQDNEWSEANYWLKPLLKK